MPELTFERYAPHSPDQMLALAWDVKNYPDFVPNCSAMDVWFEEGRTDQCHARMQVQFGPISQAYTSIVTLNEENHTVAAEAIDGPFSYLESMWRLEPDGEGTRVSFSIDFNLSNRMLAALAEPAFAAKQEEVIDAFMAEADRRYTA